MKLCCCNNKNELFLFGKFSGAIIPSGNGGIEVVEGQVAANRASRSGIPIADCRDWAQPQNLLNLGDKCLGLKPTALILIINRPRSM